MLPSLPKPKYAVGDWVRIHWPPNDPIGQIIEVRSPIGRDWTPLYEVRIDRDYNPAFYTAGEEELEPAEEPETTVRGADFNIDRLSVANRLALIAELWESLSGELARRDLTPSQREAVERRWAELRGDPEKAGAWVGIQAAALARLAELVAPETRASEGTGR